MSGSIGARGRVMRISQREAMVSRTNTSRRRWALAIGARRARGRRRRVRRCASAWRRRSRRSACSSASSSCRTRRRKRPFRTTPVVRASPQQGFRISVRRQRQRRAPARRAAIRRSLLSRRRHAGDRGHVDPAARASDPRRHAQRHLRFSLHARLRRRSHGHPGRVRRCAASSRGPSLTAGKFKVPVGLERLVSATDFRFIERALSDEPRAESRPRSCSSAATSPAAS